MLPDLSNSRTAAKNLLGWKLTHYSPAGILSGYVVETEAYHMDDPASHTFNGITPRNRAMFEVAGTIYIYFTYGIHYCVNIVAGAEGSGEGVLIRALQPVEGIRLMQRNRKLIEASSQHPDIALPQLTNGPGKLVQAMGITKALYGTHISTGPLRLEPGFTPEQIVQTTRIGIKKATEQPWRFYVADNPFVSKRIKR